jgi:hypothetical protein
VSYLGDVVLVLPSLICASSRGNTPARALVEEFVQATHGEVLVHEQQLAPLAAPAHQQMSFTRLRCVTPYVSNSYDYVNNMFKRP